MPVGVGRKCLLTKEKLPQYLQLCHKNKSRAML